jgi:alpha-L-fucosidase 2
MMKLRYLLLLSIVTWSVLAQPPRMAAWAAKGELRKDVEYARPGGTPLTFDAWIPEGAGPHAAVIVVHGGGWENGTKYSFVPPLFPPLSNAGFAWFTIDYRLAPKNPYPAAVEDVKAAVRYVKAHAAELKVDAKRLALMGESAGGHLVALVAAQNEPDTSVAAVVDFYGLHDFTVADNITRNRAQFLDLKSVDEATGRARMREASPLTYVRKGLPPFLMIHGTNDAAVPYDQSVMMCARLRLAGNSCELYTVPEAPHGVGPWEREARWQGYKDKMVAWLRQTLR